MKKYLSLICLLLLFFFQQLFILPSYAVAKPEIIFIPGLQLQAKDYQTTLTFLQQQGYSVHVYQPHYQDPSNYQRIVTTWTKGVARIIHTKKVILIGHSIGGATAVHFCATDARCLAGINLDGTPAFTEKLSVPFLYIQGGLGRYCTGSCLTGRSLMEIITKQSHTSIVKIPAIKHMNFTDDRNLLLYLEGYLSFTDGRSTIQHSIQSFLQKV